MLGIFDRIKSWFTRRAKPFASSPETSSPTVPTGVVSEPEADAVTAPVTEGDVLVQEHTQLEAERTRLRQEITVVDSQYSSGEISAANRDRAYRVRLARAGSIRVRQMEIRSRLAEMEHPVPQEWGAVRIFR